MTAQPPQVPVQKFVPMDFCLCLCSDFFSRNPAQAKGLHWSSSQLEVTQDSQVMGPCVKHAQVQKKVTNMDYDKAQSDHDSRECNSPKSWERYMALPIICTQS